MAEVICKEIKRTWAGQPILSRVSAEGEGGGLRKMIRSGPSGK